MSPAGELGDGCVLCPLLWGWSPGKARMMCTLPASCTWLLSPCSHLPAGRRHILTFPGHRRLHGPGWLQAVFEDWLRGRISRLQPSFLSNSLPTVQYRREAPEGLGTSLWLPRKFTLQRVFASLLNGFFFIAEASGFFCLSCRSPVSDPECMSPSKKGQVPVFSPRRSAMNGAS